ncbi:MAG: cofactor-independent phosphoglycerate mutase [Chloroflexota bacterium]|nr:cofactor-independent phosphoglycerate mutase [Chloroflexota bacterium]
MKYCILIMDGAAGWPLAQYDDKTSLQLAHTPNLDSLAQQGVVGLARTVPPGMEPSSACACMAIMGYAPDVYYSGRGPIEARSMGIQMTSEDVVFRCNLVAIRHGRMWSYNCGGIGDEDSHPLIQALNAGIKNRHVQFYPGVGYRHICRITNQSNTLKAICTPPHDISGKLIRGFLPHGIGSAFLKNLMSSSEPILKNHPVNIARQARGEIAATTIWPFWGGTQCQDLPPFHDLHGIDAAITSGVDLLRGLAKLSGIGILDIPGVTAGADTDYIVQTEGALQALDKHDLVIIHIESPDEAGHNGSVEEKVHAIQKIDREVVGRLISRKKNGFRMLIMPDHPTPIDIKTHVSDPVPFILWGDGFQGNGTRAYSEIEASSTDLIIEQGHVLMDMLVNGVGIAK